MLLCSLEKAGVVDATVLFEFVDLLSDTVEGQISTLVLGSRLGFEVHAFRFDMIDAYGLVQAG